MIPFLRKTQEASASAPVEHVRREPDEETEDIDGLTVAAQDLCDAVHKRDYKAVAEALKAAFAMMDEGPEETTDTEDAS